MRILLLRRREWGRNDGSTCHAAILARELEKPCVVGTNIATQVLKNGDLVEVDANTGTVRILPS